MKIVKADPGSADPAGVLRSTGALSSWVAAPIWPTARVKLNNKADETDALLMPSSFRCVLSAPRLVPPPTRPEATRSRLTEGDLDWKLRKGADGCQGFVSD